jgi:hypothetical protein
LGMLNRRRRSSRQSNLPRGSGRAIIQEMEK